MTQYTEETQEGGMGRLAKIKKWAGRILMGITAVVFIVIFTPLLILKLILKLILEFIEKFTAELTLAGVVTIVILLLCRG